MKSTAILWIYKAIKATSLFSRGATVGSSTYLICQIFTPDALRDTGILHPEGFVSCPRNKPGITIYKAILKF